MKLSLFPRNMHLQETRLQILPTKYYNYTDTAVLTLNYRKQSHQKRLKTGIQLTTLSKK